MKLEGVVTAPPAPGITPYVRVVGAALLRGKTIGATQAVTGPFHPVTIESHESVFLVVRYATVCSATSLAEGSGFQTWSTTSAFATGARGSSSGPRASSCRSR